MTRAIQLVALLTLFFASTGRAAAVALTSQTPSPDPIQPAGVYDDAPPTGLESRNGLLCHNDPINRVDPDGLAEDWMDEFVNDAARSSGPARFRAMGANLFHQTNEGIQQGTRLAAEGAKEYIIMESGARSAGMALGAVGKIIPKVANSRLGNIVADLYKGTKAKDPVGTGSTADAIRKELMTGLSTGGKFHSEKGRQYLKALEKWMERNPGASDRDRMVADTLRRDLQNALKGR